jgi:predicted RNase H-like HicB family nuclease
MDQPKLAFTAVYLKSGHGYVGFIEELPGVNSHGRTLEEARQTLRDLAALVFDEERREAEALIAGKEVVRESFLVPLPRPEQDLRQIKPAVRGHATLALK